MKPNIPKVRLLTGDSRELFLKFMRSDADRGRKVLSPFLFISMEKKLDSEKLLVAPLQFDEYGVKAEFKKLQGSLLENYMALPKARILVDNNMLGPKVEIYLTEAFKNNPDDIAVGIKCKNGVLWAWMPQTFSTTPPTPAT